MNLYVVEYELVGNSYASYDVKIEEALLPTHIIAESKSNATETALKYSTMNFQLKRCFLSSNNVNVIAEVL